MKLTRFRPDRKIHTKEVLNVPQERVKPFDFEQEFEPLKVALDVVLEKWAEWPNPPQELWTTLGYLHAFFPEQKDKDRYLDYAKVYQVFVQKGRESTAGMLMVFHLMQLFPDKRKQLLEQIGSDPNEMPFKVSSGELFLINELLVLSAAQPERLHEYQARARQELTSVKRWIEESFTFENQLRITLQLAANFLILCPEYKIEMQNLFEPHVRKVLDTKKFSEYTHWLQTLCNLEIVYGSDEFSLDHQGNLVRHPSRSRLDASRPLPDRLTA